MSMGVSSIILFKFRSNPNFEPLPMPGTSARLFDIKRGIVRAKKLDRGGTPEFDLSVKNATTNEEYLDESMLLPRGTRVIVQRRPAVPGRGLLARIAQSETGGASSGVMNTSLNSHSNSSYYTINSRDRDEEDEFVDNDEEDVNPTAQTEAPPAEDTELAALKAVMDEGSSLYRPGGAIGNKTWTVGNGSMPAGSGMPQKQAHYQRHQKHHVRPNADPELREQEQRQQPKKRATGIPRTFLQFETGNNGEKSDDNDAGPNDDKTMDVAGGGLARIQPSTAGFAELIAHKGGQSAGHPTRSIEYALKLTSTDIPKDLTCGICNGLVKNAMFLHWDEEGRTACETCIRDALTENGFRCPLTGKDGISPDELFPNHQLRKSADRFVKEVMEKVELIEKEQLREEEEAKKEEERLMFEGDAGDKGIIISKKRGREKSGKDGNDLLSDDDDDDFGGDVFDVSKDEAPENEDEKLESEEEKNETVAEKSNNILTSKSDEPNNNISISDTNKNLNPVLDSKMNNEVQSETKNVNEGAGINPARVNVSIANLSHKSRQPPSKKIRRGPPAGYALGPAGGAVVTPTVPPPFPPPGAPNLPPPPGAPNLPPPPGAPNLPPPPGAPNLPPPPPRPPNPSSPSGRGNGQGDRGGTNQSNFNDNYDHQQNFHGGRGRERGRGGGRGRPFHRGGPGFDINGHGPFGGPPPPYGMNPEGDNNFQRHPKHHNHTKNDQRSKDQEQGNKVDNNNSQHFGGKDGPPEQFHNDRERYHDGPNGNGHRHFNQRNNFPHRGDDRHRGGRMDNGRRFDDGGRWGNHRRGGDGGRWGGGRMGPQGRGDGGRWGGRFGDGGRWGAGRGGRGGRGAGRGFHGGRGHFYGRGRY